ncbi:MAG TPA: hypothetical protein VFC78_03880 [Tepidisphaeraceae bacterium]|nr:hypothetical protein [Tepidisphaeraceae bacterium]
MNAKDSNKDAAAFFGDGPLDRATQALRDAAIPDGPSPALIAQTRMALRADAPGFFTRAIARPRVFRIAAAIAFLAGGTVACWIALHRPRLGGTSAGKQWIAHQPAAPTNGNPAPPSQVAIAPSVGAAFAEAHPAADPAEGPAVPPGQITGRVVFSGTPPRMLPAVGVNLAAPCAARHKEPILDESVVVNKDGALANVVVSISAGLPPGEQWAPPGEPVVLDQKDCVFHPHVLAVMVGQPMEVRNSDPFLHNVHMLAVNNPTANFGQPMPGQKRLDPFEVPEVFQVRCDVHPWMRAWVRVVDNPFFAVTGRDGRFTIRQLPPGTYTLKAWQEELGVREKRVILLPGRGAWIDFAFRGGNEK